MVKFSKKRGNLHSRRGISTIVGGAIFLVLFASAFSTFFIAMDFQRDTINTQRAISESIMEKTKEQFSIAVSADDASNNRIGIQVKNSGTNAVEIDNIWIVNKSGNYPAQKHLINYTDAIIPPGYGSDILENTPLHFTVADDYDIKVVSTLGTIKKAEYSVGAGNNLRAELIAIPPDVKVGQNVTMIMHVENIGKSSLVNVIPFNDVTMDNYPSITPPFTSPDPPVPLPVDLDPGEGAFFSWDYVTTGSAGSIVKFEGYATAQEEYTGFIMNSNTAVEKIELQTPDESEVIVLTQDLIGRPELFLVIPSPMGHSIGDQGVWGANIVNPTGSPMSVSRVTISLLSPRENNSDEMFNPTGAPGARCDETAVGPTTTNDWDCNVQNQLTWSDLDDPIIIPPFSSHQFTAKVHADHISGTQSQMSAVIVVGDVFTDLGAFSKAGYSSSFDDDNSGTSVVNVYMTSVPDSTKNDEILTTISAIPSGSTNTYHATLVDFEAAGREIEAGAKFIINIPKGWVIDDWVNDIDGHGDFNIAYTVFSDTSSQIVGTLNAEYFGNGPVDYEGISISFDARAPVVTNTQMYVMYLLAEGKIDEGDFQIGPLSEVVLQVVP